MMARHHRKMGGAHSILRFTGNSVYKLIANKCDLHIPGWFIALFIGGTLKLVTMASRLGLPIPQLSGCTTNTVC